MSPRANRSRYFALVAGIAVLASLAMFSPEVIPQEAPPADTPKPDPFGRQPPPTLPYGLSCSECAIAKGSMCGALLKAEVIVEVRQMHPLHESSRCYKSEPLEGVEVEECFVSVAHRFEQVTVLRSPTPKLASEIFHSNYSVEESSEPSAGIKLWGDTRYVLFARPAREGQWFVLGACPIYGDHVLPGTNE